ncbi:hypothetical protein HYDPIDRAFT_119369 [Hydnomerulius pinastri MD-312]|uniref:Uncharacterized protein n=1 Tax=Hydnomerulius pinastri MD-312 TaxID=994086 RepID=A0A0C9W7X1_9AGAM|nr:hypothetical protein HYDPIDRAFT_119369 [Hydnomerulius pinastri MD-312]
MCLCENAKNFVRRSSNRLDDEYTEFHDVATRSLVDAEKACLDLLTDGFDTIRNLQLGLTDELREATAKCAMNSPKVLESWLGVVPRWNSYHSSMRHKGHYGQWNLNEMLTKEMVNDTSLSSWNQAMNTDIPSEAKSTTKDVCSQIRLVKQRIVLLAPAMYRQRIGLAYNKIDESQLLTTARTRYLDQRARQQRRFGGSFAPTLEEQLSGHYDQVASEHGVGAFARMQDANHVKFRDAAQIFESLLETVIGSFDAIDNTGLENLEDVVKSIFHRLRNGLDKDDSEVEAVPAATRYIKTFEDSVQTHLVTVNAILDQNTQIIT